MNKVNTYTSTQHAAVRTEHFVYNQLIPYIGNKRKLLGLVQESLRHTGQTLPATFLDLFAGSGVVSRMAKSLGYRVIANDWEPYARTINSCYIGCNLPPRFEKLDGYTAATEKLNQLPPRVDWVTEHLCPRDDDKFDIDVDRMFFMRKNGMRIDAVRHQIGQWKKDGVIDDVEQNCLLAPLLYQTCYTSNTSGVFKGFHNGWGGQTGTALYRIAGDLQLNPAVLHDNGRQNSVTCQDAQSLAGELADRELDGREVDVAYLDPPYNQHPYGSNYHVLNSVALWDKPELPKRITPGTKAAIRTDWRSERRSDYNYKDTAAAAYSKLIDTLGAHFIMTSYSTDGTVPLPELLQANLDRGHVQIETRGYKRYRVSSQRFSKKPMNVEFVIVVDTRRPCNTSVDELLGQIESTESQVLSAHREC